jgi:hypothetical protein
MRTMSVATGKARAREMGLVNSAAFCPLFAAKSPHLRHREATPSLPYGRPAYERNVE